MISKPNPETTSEKLVIDLEKTFRQVGVKKANILIDLLSYIVPAEPACSKAVHATRRTLKALEKPATLQTTLANWLQQRRVDYAAALVEVLASSDATVEEIQTAVAAAAVTHQDTWRAVIKSVLRGQVREEARDLVFESFVARFGDLRREAMRIVQDGVGSVRIRMDLLANCAAPVETPSARDDHAPTGRDLRKGFGVAWIAVLKDSELSVSEKRYILGILSSHVIPNSSNPLQLADFLTDAYNNDEDISIRIAALDGLFTLISKHGLDYPLFYQKLYALLTPDALFFCEGRERFLQLTASFLRRGAMLPGGLVAAFIKRLVRRALQAPPAATLWCLRLALDLLYKHPNVSFLVHRSVNLFEATGSSPLVGKKRPRTGGLSDPFDDREVDPQASRANESSLWELELLRHHVSPAVSRLVTSFSTDVRKKAALPPGSLADYEGLTFEDMFQAEFKRRPKSWHLAYETPGSSAHLKSISLSLHSSISWS